MMMNWLRCSDLEESLLGLDCKVVAENEDIQDLPRENQVNLSQLALNCFDNHLQGCLWIEIV